MHIKSTVAADSLLLQQLIVFVHAWNVADGALAFHELDFDVGNASGGSDVGGRRARRVNELNGRVEGRIAPGSAVRK